MECMQFEIIDKFGNKTMCDVVATYHDDDTNKDFIIYTDRSLDKNKNLRLYYSLYKQKDGNIKLIDITDVGDKMVGLELIKELLSDLNSD